MKTFTPKTLTEGDYNYKILSAKEETKESSYGPCQILKMYVLVDGTVKTGMTLWLNESSRNKQALEQFLDSLHQIDAEGNVTLNGWDSLPGMEGRAHFKPVTKGDYTYYNASGWTPYEAPATEAPTPAEEPPKEPESPPKEDDTPFEDEPIEGQISMEDCMTASDMEGYEQKEILAALEEDYDPKTDPFNLENYSDFVPALDAQVIDLIEKYAGKELSPEKRIVIKYILDRIV